MRRFNPFIACYFICLAVIIAGTGSIAAKVPPATNGGSAITVWSHVQTTAEVIAQSDTLVLAGLTEAADAPLDLALIWHKDTDGWFTTWSLRLVSHSHNMKDAGTSQEGSHIQLVSTNPPIVGDTYAAALSYDSATGTVSVTVDNLTKNTRLASQVTTIAKGLARENLQPYAGGDATIIRVANEYVPLAARWYLMAGSPEAASISDVVGTHDTKSIQINVPGVIAPGTFEFYAETPLGRRLIHRVVTADERVVDELSAALPAGQYDMTMQYVAYDEVLLTETRPVSVGRVDFHLNVATTDIDAGTVTGTYTVTSDSTLVGTDITIMAQWVEMTWNDTAGRYSEGSRTDAVPVASTRVDIDTQPRDITFIATVPEAESGTIWKLILTPLVSPAMHTVVDKNEYVIPYPHSPGTELRLMSFNIRFPTDNDGAHAWELRNDLVLQVIGEYAPDIIGFQEPWAFQMAFLHNKLADYEGIGFNHHGLVHNALFHNDDRLELMQWDTFWLSETPDRPGRTPWGANARGVIWARYRIRSTDQTIVVLNTHLRSTEAATDEREYGTKQMADFVRQLPAGEPVFVLGDFNSAPNSSAYRALAGGRAAPVRDAWTSAISTYGPEGTFHGFTGTVGSRRIDWIMFGGSALPLTMEHITLHDGNRYPSDHLPIQASFYVW